MILRLFRSRVTSNIRRRSFPLSLSGMAAIDSANLPVVCGSLSNKGRRARKISSSDFPAEISLLICSISVRMSSTLSLFSISKTMMRARPSRRSGRHSHASEVGSRLLMDGRTLSQGLSGCAAPMIVNRMVKSMVTVRFTKRVLRERVSSFLRSR